MDAKEIVESLGDVPSGNYSFSEVLKAAELGIQSERERIVKALREFGAKDRDERGWTILMEVADMIEGEKL